MTKTKINLFEYKADDGKWLTDGETYAKVVYLAVNADESVWKEITQEQYESELSAKQ